MPYARTLGALVALAATLWLTTLGLLFFVLRGNVPIPLLDFSTVAAGTTTVVASVVWLCAFAAAGRAALIEQIGTQLKTEAEGIYWRAYADVTEAVLFQSDGAGDGDGSGGVRSAPPK